MYKEIILKSGSRVRYLNLVRAMVRCKKSDHLEFHKWVNLYQVKSMNIYNKKFWISRYESNDSNACDKYLKIIRECIEEWKNEQSEQNSRTIFIQD